MEFYRENKYLILGEECLYFDSLRVEAEDV